MGLHRAGPWSWAAAQEGVAGQRAPLSHQGQASARGPWEAREEGLVTTPEETADSRKHEIEQVADFSK